MADPKVLTVKLNASGQEIAEFASLVEELPTPSWTSTEDPTRIRHKPELGTASAHPTEYFATAAEMQMLAQVAWDGLYNSLQSRPTLATVATSGLYVDLSGLPTLGTAASQNATAFATSSQGTKADTAVQPATLSGYATASDLSSGLSGKLNTPAGTTAQYVRGDGTLSAFPSIPSAQVNTDWNSVSGVSQLLNKPTLGTAAAQNSTAFATAAQGVLAASSVQPAGLTKAAVGLGNCDNTSDASKPVSTAQQTALNSKEPTVTAGTTLQYWRGDKTWQTLPLLTIGDPVVSSVTLNSAFQPRASGPCVVNIMGSYSAVISGGVVMSVQWSSTSGGAYVEVGVTNLITLAAVLGLAKETISVPVPSGYWLKVVATGGTPTVTKAIWNLDG